MGELTGKEIINQWNKTRNALKHLTVDEAAPYLTVNFCDEAYWMIRRSLANAQRLQLTVVTAQEFEEWFIHHAL